MRDLIHNFAFRPAYAPAVQAAAGDGITIDTLGFNSLGFVVNTGAIVGSGDFGVKLQDSDDGTTWADVAASQVQQAATPVPGTLAAASAYKIGYAGFKRYVHLSLTKAGGTSIALSAMAVLSYANQRPVA